MHGFYFDFLTGDIAIDETGAIGTATIDSQNCALISLSQVCRLTKPEVGAQIGARIINRKRQHTSAVLAEARRMVEADGGKNVSVQADNTGRLQFKATYGDD